MHNNKYVFTILYITLHIAGDATNKEFSIIDDKCFGQVNYAIKEAENLVCITEDKVQHSLLKGFTQNIKQLKSLYEINKRK